MKIKSNAAVHPPELIFRKTVGIDPQIMSETVGEQIWNKNLNFESLERISFNLR